MFVLLVDFDGCGWRVDSIHKSDEDLRYCLDDLMDGGSFGDSDRVMVAEVKELYDICATYSLEPSETF